MTGTAKVGTPGQRRAVFAVDEDAELAAAARLERFRATHADVPVFGLAGVVDPDVIERLYQENTGPAGELLVKRRLSKAASDREAAAVAATGRRTRTPAPPSWPRSAPPSAARTRTRCRTST